MSIEAVARVWLEYPGGGPDFRLALAIADSTGFDDYVYIEAKISLLHYARLTEAAYVRALAKLHANRWLEVVDAQECLYRFGPESRRVGAIPPGLPAAGTF